MSTFSSLPSSGSTSWFPWATDVHNAAIGARTRYVVPDVVADGVTDDRAAIQTAINGLPATGHYTIWLPGLCFIGSAGTSGGAPYGLAITRNDLTFTGAPGAGFISNVAGMRLVACTGPGLTGNTPTDPLVDAGWATAQTVYPFTTGVTQNEDSSAVTLQNSADGAHFAPGDIVFLRTGSLTTSTLNREPDAELNEVVSVSSGTINLKFALAKPYQQEFFPSGSTGSPSSPTGGGTACAFGISNLTGNTITNITFRGLKIYMQDNTGGTTFAVFVLNAWGVHFENCRIESGKYGIGGRFARRVTLDRCTLHTYGATSDGDPAWLAPSTGCGDWVATSCRGTGATPAKLHLHEGTHDIHYLDWVSRTPSAATGGPALLDIRARAYRHVHEIDVVGTVTAGVYDTIMVTSEVVGLPGQVYIKRARLRGNPGRSHINLSDDCTVIEPTGLDIKGTPIVLYTGTADPFGLAVSITAAQMIASTGTPVLDINTNGGTAFLLDQTTQEGIQASVDVPVTWRLWQLEANVQGVGAPVGGADTVRLQGIYSVGGGSSTNGTAVNFVIPDTTSVSTVVIDTSRTGTGNQNFKLLRIAANAADTYASDLRVRSLTIRRLA